MLLPFRRVLTFSLLLLAGVAGHAAATPEVVLRIKHGDDPRWAAADWDDTEWEVVGRTDGRPHPGMDVFPARTGIFWIRYQVTRSTEKSWGLNLPTYLWPADEPGAPVDSVFLAGPFCYEFYWDGQLIGRSGVVGASREEEVPGPLDNLMLIPNSRLGPGPHTIAMRVSTYHFNFPASRFRITPTMGNYATRLNYEARQPVVPIIGAVAALLLTVACGVLFWFAERRRPLVICGLLGFTLAGFFFLIACRWLYQEPFVWLYPRYQAMLLAMAVMGVLISMLVVEQFAMRGRWWWLAGALAIGVAVWMGTAFFQVRMLWMGRALLAYALLPAAWAVWRRRPGARLALGGVLVGLFSVQQATDIRLVLSPTFFLFFAVLVGMLLFALGWQIRQDRRRARQAQLTAARMEIELLKKNLQPHFLLNTLTAVAEVIEQDPAGAVKFIDDLAAEFRSLALMSGERLVPLQRELDLCRAHLKVISRRTGRKITLKAEGIEIGTLVPPALFLTLIENGLVHQQAESGAAFMLSTRPAGSGVAFAFQSPGRIRSQSDGREGGTGLRYVRARLEESFPGRWTLAQGPVVAGWETVIEWSTADAPGRPA